MKYAKLPAFSGIELNKLLLKDNWTEHGYRKHGISKKKSINNRTRVTIIPNDSNPLPDGTLSAILGPKQTGLGKKGLSKLLNK